MLKIEPNVICKINSHNSFYTFSHLCKNPQIPKKYLKRVKSSNLGTKSLKVRAMVRSNFNEIAGIEPMVMQRYYGELVSKNGCVKIALNWSVKIELRQKPNY